MAFDYSKLRGRIVEKCGTQEKFANATELSGRSLSLKLNNKITWRDEDIAKALKLLDIPDGEIKAYFFTEEVQII